MAPQACLSQGNDNPLACWAEAVFEGEDEVAPENEVDWSEDVAVAAPPPVMQEDGDEADDGTHAATEEAPPQTPGLIVIGRLIY